MDIINGKALRDELVRYIEKWFMENGRGTAVIGISGGKDSAVVAGLCFEALGRDRVVGVLMPDGNQADISDSYRVCDTLGIRRMTADVGAACAALKACADAALGSYGWYALNGGRAMSASDGALINVPPRARMTILYTVAQSLSEFQGEHAAVIGTGNKSERMVGYFTKGGDGMCDMNPIGDLWAEEVVAVGETMGRYLEVIHKAPSDGLCGQTDEDRLGFTYEQERLVLSGHASELPRDVVRKILAMRDRSEHKRRLPDMYVRAS